MRQLRKLTFIVLSVLLVGIGAFAYLEFDGQADNMRDDLGYYYAMTGGLFPTGNIPNGDNASGGTFRFLLDDSTWGSYPIQQWNKDDWFPENGSIALTLMNQGNIVYDNNGIEDGSGAWYYDYTDLPETSDWAKHVPGLYRGYAMSNNYDWIYAGYFKLEEDTVIDTIVGYFDPTTSEDLNGNFHSFDPASPEIDYRINIWGSYQDANSYMPNVDSFTGNVLSSDYIPGVFKVSYSGVDRKFPEWYRDPQYIDPIWRSEFRLADPILLPAGVYFFSHDAIIVTPIDIDIKPGSSPNPINLKSNGVFPVAVFGSEQINASDIDLDTVLLAGAAPVRWFFKDVNRDGYDDLFLHFDTQELMLDIDSTSADLVAFTYDGKPIKGSDTVKITPRGRK